MTVIEQVKTLLGISDDLQDNLLKVIEKLTESHFKAYTGKTDVPDELTFIIVEVIVKRFNRLGAEGMTSQGMEGLSMSFSLNDFEDYSEVFKRHYKSEFNAGFKML